MTKFLVSRWGIQQNEDHSRFTHGVGRAFYFMSKVIQNGLVGLRHQLIRWSGLVLLGVVPGLAQGAPADWQPAKGPLMTRWSRDVSPENPLPEYPRPQMVRREWKSLNGLWDYSIQPQEAERPRAYEGEILVPFPVESALSGVMRKVGDSNKLWYRRAFSWPKEWRNRRVLLHFGAVDWEATVYVNGLKMGLHRGGYDDFTIDVTDALRPIGPQELVVGVWDPSDAGWQPRGKQISNPNGIWYTSVTGIWQTPWLEPVEPVSVDSVKLVPDIDARVLNVTVTLRGGSTNAVIEASALDGWTRVGKGSGKSGEPFQIPIPHAKLWSPDSPHLYDLKISVRNGRGVVDEVKSYFGMRKSSLARDDKGVLRLNLNNQPVFQFGPLDQGWWPDGLYTAPTDEALRFDIEMTKKLGFNMARKHVKVEPDRWYYWCDKLGLLVWQDMPSGFVERRRGAGAPPARSPAEGQQFEHELKREIDGRGNHPSIVMWVPFNEGWGQYDTERVTEWVKQYDPSRLVNNASGWTDHKVGDVHDIHVYPGPQAPKIEHDRAGVLGEFGGLGLPLPGHTWQDKANWGYRSFETSDALTDAYIGLITKLHPLVGEPGLSAAVYTQTTDVEVEVNGLMTYDRARVKMTEAKIRKANLTLYTPAPPAPVVKTLMATSHDQAQSWHYTLQAPAGDWFQAAFDDAIWKTGPGGFGTRSTPGAVVGTEWNTSDIWLRRSVELPADFKASDLRLSLHHDDEAEVYLNGQLAGKFTGYTSNYETFEVAPAARLALKPGRNVIAVHCHQISGGQFIDCGVENLVPKVK